MEIVLLPLSFAGHWGGTETGSLAGKDAALLHYL